MRAVSADMTGERSDLYAILGLSACATGGEIRRAYRTLIRRNHPDTRTMGDVVDTEAQDATVHEVIAAYTVLGDPARRAAYDRSTTVQQVQDPTQVRPERRAPQGTREGPPIQAGPVRWYPSR